MAGFEVTSYGRFWVTAKDDHKPIPGPRNNFIREQSRQCLTVKSREKSGQSRSQRVEEDVESFQGEAMDSANYTTRPQRVLYPAGICVMSARRLRIEDQAASS